ncbi:hypothetical protein E6O75_ATG03022 [Venturia nashicola]|uniref:Uncharacterized protein n=1 Tax=Venturia nashicola TaxID=86259 RepID=A0A4Z1PDR3_9PEZI|nr:hypothetical protein E6O75_ATG03022 [Venturia nashicola]
MARLHCAHFALTLKPFPAPFCADDLTHSSLHVKVKVKVSEVTAGVACHSASDDILTTSRSQTTRKPPHAPPEPLSGVPPHFDKDALRSAATLRQRRSQWCTSDKPVMSDVVAGFTAACSFGRSQFLRQEGPVSSAPHVWWRPTCDEMWGFSTAQDHFWATSHGDFEGLWEATAATAFWRRNSDERWIGRLVREEASVTDSTPERWTDIADGSVEVECWRLPSWWLGLRAATSK